MSRIDLLSRLGILCIVSILLNSEKLAERARVRASGSTATSAPAWRLRLKSSSGGYKKLFHNWKRHPVSNADSLQAKLEAQASLPAAFCERQVVFRKRLSRGPLQAGMPALPGRWLDRSKDI